MILQFKIKKEKKEKEGDADADDTYMPRVSNRDANGNLTSHPLCVFPSISTQSTAKKVLQ